MILSFKIENFRSIKEPLTIDLTTEKRLKEDDLPNNSFQQNGKELIKSLLLYGRNASGKSNVLNALGTLNILIGNSDKFKYEEKIKFYEPFLFDKDFANKPVRFEIDFITTEGKTKFKYILSYNADEIVFEALYIYPSGTKAKLFERKKDKITYGEYYKGTKKAIENDLLKNQLFLSKSASSKIEYLNECYLYFSSLLIFTIHDTEFDKTVTDVISSFLNDSELLKHNLLELLKAGDTSINDFKIIEKGKNKYAVLTSHSVFENGEKVGNTFFELEKESLGTKKLFAIGGYILTVINFGGVIIIDELDKGLHPLLSKLIIKMFNSKKNNPNNAQLLFATHDSTLLDLEILRRDQICFIDKEYEEHSICYKLSDIKGVRKDIPIDKWYLSGRFKAIPVISEPDLKFES